MAHMIPDEPPNPGPGARAERAAYEALEAGLPEGFFVYHGLRFIEGETAREGEADFVILHRELGLLVMECKGWGVRCAGTGRWVRTHRDGSEEPLHRSPFAQAEDTAHGLVRTLEPRLRHELSWSGPFPLAFGHAVIFPLALTAELNLPLDAPREILMDASDLPRLGVRVREAMGFWGRKKPKDVAGLDAKDFDRFRRKILHPNLKIVPGLQGGMRADSARMVRLTDEQAWVVEALLENRRLRPWAELGRERPSSRWKPRGASPSRVPAPSCCASIARWRATCGTR